MPTGSIKVSLEAGSLDFQARCYRVADDQPEWGNRREKDRGRCRIITQKGGPKL